MRRGKRTEACVGGPGQQKPSAAPDNSKELSAAWKSLSQTKAALRHIENRLEATPGSGGVLLHSVLDTKKTSSGSTRKPTWREGRGTDDSSQTGGASKPRGRGRGSPEKSSSRSPLRNTTQDSNVRKTSNVDFREPLASYRDTTPPPLTASQFEAYTLQSIPGPAQPTRETGDRQTDPDQNSLPSSGPGSTQVRYLNDRPALEALRGDPAPAASALASAQTPAPCSGGLAGEASASSSPASTSQKLENLRRRQPDDKLEKLKERIRKQRENLEGAAERDKLLGGLEQPILPQPHPAASKIQRKVAPAPPAPVYRGFNPSETKIRTPDGKVWREEDFHNLSQDVYRDLSRQLAESIRTRRPQSHQQPRDRRSTKPIRKVCKAGSGTGTDPEHRPVISTSSWRDGQKLVKMVLGPAPRMHQEERAHTADGPDRTGASPHRSSSTAPRPELPQRRPRSQSPGSSHTAPPSQPPPPPSSSTALLSADIRGILDDLQLERRAEERESDRGRRGRGGSVGSRTRPPMSAWGPSLRTSRSASPAKRQPEPRKQRHYDADTVRQYIAKQQEERKRRQAEERKAQREEAERRSQRLQELYRRQRGGGAGRGGAGGGAGCSSEVGELSVGPVQRRLQETYTKLLLEAQETQPGSTAVQQQQQQQRPVYQPSGESDKENKRQAPHSPSSSSDMSLSAPPPPPLSRAELGGVEGVSPQLHPAGCPITSSSMMPPADQLLSQLLGLQAGAAMTRRDPPPQASSRSSYQAASPRHRYRPHPDTGTDLTQTQTSPRHRYRPHPDTGTDLTQTQTSPRHRYRPHPDTGTDLTQTQTSPRHRSKMSRIEALKATAASLSSRIEGEARKLATGTGSNPGSATAMLDPQGPQTAASPSGEEGRWAPAPSPAVRDTSSSDHLALRIQRILSSAGGQSSYDAAALPGVGDLHGFKGHLEKKRSGVGEHTARPQLTNGVDRMEGWERRYGEEDGGRTAGVHDSSGGSISEGPLLSEGSTSEGEHSPPPHHRSDTRRTRPSVRLGAVDYCEAQRGAYIQGGLALFQREAEKYAPLSPTDLLTDDRPDRGSPAVRSVQSAASPGDAAAYEDDFVSLRGSGGSGQSKKGCSGRRGSHGRRGAGSDRSDSTVVGEHRSPCSPPSETPSASSRKRGSERTKNSYSDATPGGAPGLSPHSLASDSKKSPDCSPNQPSIAASPPGAASPSKPPDSGSSPGLGGPGQGLGPGGSPAKTRSRPSPAHAVYSTAPSNRADAMTTAELQFAPSVLHQRLSAELTYLDSIEESVRQLGDVERIRGVSLAQQESVSLAQILKAQKQRHERDLYELKIKAEREALEAQLELDESRQRAARAHMEVQQSMVQAQQHSLVELHEATAQMISQQTQAARYIREMKELSLSQTPGPAPPLPTLLDQQRQRHGSSTKQLQSSSRSEGSASRTRPQEGLSSLGSDSCSDSLPSRRPNISGGDSSSHHSPSEQRERRTDTISMATEYSLKFDGSMTEDEMEERSFRSLLPSEAHRRGTLEKRPRPQEESEDETANQDRSSPSAAHDSSKAQDSSLAFSGGQGSFSRFTMDMVRQYMQDEEVRAHHQSSLLLLRQKALKEKTRAQLAWLEHQKRRLRDKGEDDKMPPIRKKQRGLLMKLQQEQAEIKRLQEANRAARKERQMLLKQQEEIERMRHSTLRIKERLKCAGGETPPESPVSEALVSGAASPSAELHAGGKRSPSPSLSVSGSETSSIMEKLKKMRSHADEKAMSPVLCFFSVLSPHHWASLSVCLPKLHPKLQLYVCHHLARFLTKREQHLLQRRQQAEELLQWKQRLDQEEAEVRRMEKALSGWDRAKAPSNRAGDRSEVSSSSPSQPPQSPGPRGLPDQASPGSEVVTESSVHTDLPDSPMTGPPSHQGSPASYSQDFPPSSSPSPRSTLPPRASHSPSQTAGGSITTQLQSASNTLSHTHTQTTGQDTHTEAMSEPSDIESRIGALKEELGLRRSVVYQLKKEQKKRHKERLKAQEASLLKQLESYNVFIQRTRAELKKKPDSTPAARPQIKTPHSSSCSTEKPPIRSESSRSVLVEEGDELSPSGRSRSTSLPEEISDEDPPTVTPTPVQGSPEHPTSAMGSLISLKPLSRAGSGEAPSLSSIAQPRASEAGDRSPVSSLRSDVMEELEVEGRSESERLLKLDPEEGPGSQQNRPGSDPSSGAIRPHSRAERDRPALEGASPRETVSLATSRPASEHNDRSYTPDSRREAPPLKDPDRSPASTGGYQEDFECSVEASPRGDIQRSSPASSSQPEDKASLGASSRSQTPLEEEEEVEEDIAEEFSGCSGTSNGSRYSDRLFEASVQGHSKEKSLIHSNHSPTLSPSRTTPPSPLSDHMPDFSVGDRVLVSNVQPGTLRFKGQTQFANGFWAGVELDKSEGSNNGTYDDVAYFECQECHGIFAPPDKITRLPEKFEMEGETTEDEDSFFDDLSDKDAEERRSEKKRREQRGGLKSPTEPSLSRGHQTGEKPPSDHGQGRNLDNRTAPNEKSIPNGRNVILELEDAPSSFLISDVERIGLRKQRLKETPSLALPSPPEHPPDTGEEPGPARLSAFADKLLDSFVKDAVKHFTQIRKAKEEKIATANERRGGLFHDGEEEEEEEERKEKTLLGRQKDGLPFFLDVEQAEACSPELCNQPESPVLGTRGQEELAKRLVELELSRGLLDQLADQEEEEEPEQDWFDEDYGLSSRRQQQKLQQKQKEEDKVEKGGGLVAAPGEGQQDKIPPRPELPLPQPPKLPEQPAMVVPHTASQVEKLVLCATQEIWDSCGLGRGEAGTGTLAGVPLPKPSQAYLLGQCPASSDPPDLGKETLGDEQEAVCNRSYRQAVYDLTWELLQEIYGEDPGSQHPQWVKPRRANSSYSHRVRTPAGADLSMVQAYVTSEVLKLYRLKKDNNQKTDWQKMLKFGRKKRDRVDHILVQELHEEEAQWVDYDEDELFVKQQLADSIFEALLKDTADAFTHIHNARTATATPLA
ncbi:centrosome-associated protein 350 [Aplochiton taeniatus]